MRVIHDTNTWGLAALYFALLYTTTHSQTELNQYWNGLLDSLNFLILKTVPDSILSVVSQERLAFALLTQVTLESAFWFLVCLVYTLEWSGLLEPYRLQPPPPPSKKKQEDAMKREAFLDVVVSHNVIRPFLLLLIQPLVTQRLGPLSAPLPSFATFSWQVFCCMMIDDTYFYWMHRLCHAVPFLYKHIHKKHHLMRRPHVFSTEYAHPIEDLVVNSMGTIIGPLLVGTHPILFVLYPMFKLYQSMEAHSGFNLRFPFSVTGLIDSMDCAPAHDFHHSANIGNFGGWFMFWDWLMGTDYKYENYVMVKKSSSLAHASARRPYLNDQKHF